MALRTASVSGKWSDTTTWGGESLPVIGDFVTINNGITVEFDAESVGIATLLSRIPNGIFGQRITVVSPTNPFDAAITLIKGDSYDERPILFTDGGNWPDLTLATFTFEVTRKGYAPALFNSVVQYFDTVPASVSIKITSQQTALLPVSSNVCTYKLLATIPTLDPLKPLFVTLAFGVVNAVA